MNLAGTAVIPNCTPGMPTDSVPVGIVRPLEYRLLVGSVPVDKVGEKLELSEDEGWAGDVFLNRY